MPHLYKNVQGWSGFVPFYDKVLDEAPEHAILVEVGVWLGSSAIYMGELIKEKNKKVDFWAIDWFEGSDEHKDLIRAMPKPLMMVTLDNIRNAGVKDYVQLLKADSTQSAQNFDTESVFMSFIDADHKEESVRRDIAAWWPKIACGGYLSGHDYGGWTGVKTAVDEFCLKTGLPLQHYTEAWYIQKPHAWAGSYQEVLT